MPENNQVLFVFPSFSLSSWKSYTFVKGQCQTFVGYYHSAYPEFTRKTQRPGLDEALTHLRKGDVLVVWRLDRLGRSLKHLIELVNALEERGIGFQSLQESIDTTTSGGKLIFHIFGALAEFERNLIQERTHAGLAVARARGRTGGRPKALDAKETALLYRLYDEKKHSIQEICELVGVSKSTLYSYLRGRDAENMA